MSHSERTSDMEVQLEWNQSMTWPSSTSNNSASATTNNNNNISDTYDWSFICVMVFVVAGTLGNILVCLAVWFERPLQNVTNWFLVSLAFADLIVSTIVMPFGATAGFLGTHWPACPSFFF